MFVDRNDFASFLVQSQCSISSVAKDNRRVNKLAECTLTKLQAEGLLYNLISNLNINFKLNFYILDF